MKRILIFSLLWFWVMSCLVFPPLSRGEDQSPGSPGQAGAKPSPSGTVKEKAKEEMKEVQKDAHRAGQEIKKSTQELPGQAGKEFKKTGRALKDAGKEIKDNAQESFEDLKKLLKK